MPKERNQVAKHVILERASIPVACQTRCSKWLESHHASGSKVVAPSPVGPEPALYLMINRRLLMRMVCILLHLLDQRVKVQQ